MDLIELCKNNLRNFFIPRKAAHSDREAGKARAPTESPAASAFSTYKHVYSNFALTSYWYVRDDCEYQVICHSKLSG